MCFYTLIDISFGKVLVKIRMKSNEWFLKNELLNELTPQNNTIFAIKQTSCTRLHNLNRQLCHGIIRLYCANATLEDSLGTGECFWRNYFQNGAFLWAPLPNYRTPPFFSFLITKIKGWNLVCILFIQKGIQWCAYMWGTSTQGPEAALTAGWIRPKPSPPILQLFYLSI